MNIDSDGSFFQAYVPKSLFGIVDVIAQFKSNTPASYKVLPNGKIELQFLLEGSDLLYNNFAESSGNNNQFADMTPNAYKKALKRDDLETILLPS
jgi:hypothetical protein